MKNTASIHIRASETRDATALAEIYSAEEVYSATLQLPYPSSSRWESRALPSIETGIRLVAEYEGKVVGDIFLGRSRGPRTAHVLGLGMAVHVGYQEKGIGYQLLTAAINYGFQWLNAQRIELEVYVDNTAAIGLYRKVGFEQEGVKKRAAFRNGQYVDVMQMALLRE